MSQKNETIVLVLAILVTAGLVGSGLWWVTHQPHASTMQFSAETFAKAQNVPSGLFSYGGSTSWAPIRKEVDPAIQTVWPQFQLRYTPPATGAPGSGKGIRMLLDNQLAFSQSSRSVQAKEQQEAQQKGFTLKEIPVAIDGIASVVNPNLNIQGLTVAQIKDIYTGKINNWNQIGGPNLKITAYSRRLEDSGTVEFFVENVLDGQNLGTSVQFVFRTTEALQKVSADPGGIYFASAPEVVGQCSVKPLPIGRQAGKFVPPYQEPFIPLSQCPPKRNQLNAAAFQSSTYPITRRLFVIVKENGQVDQQAGEAYANLLLTAQGQELIAKTGFVRIR